MGDIIKTEFEKPIKLPEPDDYARRVAQVIFDELIEANDARARLDAEMYRKLGSCLAPEAEI